MICASLVLLHPLLSLTHWIFRSLMLPYKSSSHSANHVRCASLRSGGNEFVIPLCGMKKQTTGPMARWKCTPSACGISPGGGDLLYPYLSADLSRSTHSRRIKSPRRGKVVAPATKRGAFPRTHNPIAKPPGLSSRGFIIPFPSGGKGQGLYPHITVLHISSHPAWRDEGGVIGEARLFSGLPWPGVRGGILQPVSFPP